MRKARVPLIIGFLLVAALFASPTILRTIPPRYLARFPEPLQRIGAPRDQAPTLPTAAAAANPQNLLETVEAEVTIEARPATPTPQLVIEPTSGSTAPKPTATIAIPTIPPTATPVPLPSTVRLEGIEHKFQSWNNCGPATLAMTLSYFGMRLSQSQTADVLKPNPEDRNVSPDELVAYVENETPFKAIFRANGKIETVKRLLADGHPVVLEIGIEPPGEYQWMGWYGHYLLVVAYDDDAQQFWVYDSWFGTSEEPLQNAHKDGRILSYSEVERYWPHFNRNYIAFYRPDEEDNLTGIIGAEMDDATMWHQALHSVQAETAAEPDNPFLWFNLGTIYNALGQYEQAATAFDQARSIGLPWRMLWYQFGAYEAYYQVGRYQEVIMLADLTLKDRPYFEESYYYKGMAQAALGDLDAARDALARAVAFQPGFAPAADALERIGN